MAVFGSFVAGQVLTAAELNAAGTWATYTPTFTQSATITKTVNWARYMQFNKLVVGSVKLTASSAGTANNKILVGLPVSASANNFIIGEAVIDSTVVDGGLTYYARTFMKACYESSTTMSFYYDLDNNRGNEASNTFLGERWGQTGIFSTGNVSYATIASGTVIYVNFVYEAA